MSGTKIVRVAAAALAAFLLSACAGEGGAPGGGGPTMDFQAIQDDIFTPNCGFAGCHDSASRQENLDLSSAAVSRANLVNVLSVCAGKLRVVPDDAAASYLLDKLGAGEEPCGSLMPEVLPPLSQAQIDAIAAWIEAGAPPAGTEFLVATSGASATTSTLP